jgi:excisionase family DNA binding protein
MDSSQADAPSGSLANRVLRWRRHEAPHEDDPVARPPRQRGGVSVTTPARTPVAGVRALGAHPPARALELAEIIADPTALTPMGVKTLLLQVAAALVALAAAPPLAEPTEPDDETLLTVDEVATRLRFVPAYVYELIRLGRLPAVREGKYVRVRPAALRGWIAKHEGVDMAASATYSPPHDGRGAGSLASSARGHAARVGRARRGTPQLDRPAGAGGARDQGAAGAADPAPRGPGPTA